jgi:hypothetical protein
MVVVIILCDLYMYLFLNVCVMYVFCLCIVVSMSFSDKPPRTNVPLAKLDPLMTSVAPSSIHMLLGDGTVVLPDAIYGEDSALFRNFAQERLSIDTTTYMRHVQQHLQDACAPRHSQFMAYRGRSIARTKFFLSSEVRASELRIYSYTGFQWGSTKFHKHIDEFPLERQMLSDIRGMRLVTTTRASGSAAPATASVVEEPGAAISEAKEHTTSAALTMNHIIGTNYLNGDDNIGFHADKTKSFTPGTSILTVSIGTSREFHIRNDLSGDTTVFTVNDGDLFVLGWKTNEQCKHAIVRVVDEIHSTAVEKEERASGHRLSLCFRDIKCIYSQAELQVKREKSAKDAEKRLLAKQRKAAEAAEAVATTTTTPTTKASKKASPRAVPKAVNKKRHKKNKKNQKNKITKMTLK